MKYARPGYKFVGGMGRFSGSLSRLTSASLSLVLDFVATPRLALGKCGCKEIAFVQFERDATNFFSFTGISLPARWSVDGGFPYTPPPGGRPAVLNLPGGGGDLRMKDHPGLNGVFWASQWIFEARDVVICVRGPSKGDSYGAIYWHFYFNWGSYPVLSVQLGNSFKSGKPTGQPVPWASVARQAPLP